MPLATIAGFKKMKMLTEDLPTVVAAIRDQPSELVELDESGENIRRKTPVVKQNMVERSIYAVSLYTIRDGSSSFNTNKQDVG